MPYWVKGALIRAGRTIIAAMLAAIIAVPFIGADGELALKAIGLALLTGLLVGLEKAVREFRIEGEAKGYADDAIVEPEAQEEPAGP